MLARLILIALLVAVGTSGLSRRGVLASNDQNVGDFSALRRIAERFKVAAAVGGVENSGAGCIGQHCVGKRRIIGRASVEKEVNVDGGGTDERMDWKAEVQSGDDGTDEQEEEEDGDGGTTLEEGRGKGGGGGKKKKGYGKMMMVIGGITKAVMLYVMIHAVALLAGKALIVAKVALAIATALALKKSVDTQEVHVSEKKSQIPDHKTSYEIIKHPHYSHVHTQSSSVDYDHGAGGGSYEGGGSRRRRRARR